MPRPDVVEGMRAEFDAELEAQIRNRPAVTITGDDLWAMFERFATATRREQTCVTIPDPQALVDAWIAVLKDDSDGDVSPHAEKAEEHRAFLLADTAGLTARIQKLWASGAA